MHQHSRRLGQSNPSVSSQNAADCIVPGSKWSCKQKQRALGAQKADDHQLNSSASNNCAGTSMCRHAAYACQHPAAAATPADMHVLCVRLQEIRQSMRLLQESPSSPQGITEGRAAERLEQGGQSPPGVQGSRGPPVQGRGPRGCGCMLPPEPPWVQRAWTPAAPANHRRCCSCQSCSARGRQARCSCSLLQA